MSDTNSNLLSRKKWQSASHFHPLTEKDVLGFISDRVGQFKGARRPLVLLDLDSTLYEVGPRSLAIFEEWLRESPEIPGDLRMALKNLAPSQMGYSIKDTLAAIGFPVVTQEMESIAATLKAFWWNRFFSSDYLSHDKPYPGAVEYANHLYDLGAELCYLTGRHDGRMRKGTETNLVRDGFPYQTSGTSLVMRQDDESSDADHKSKQAARLAGQGFLVASFENEPVNLVSLAKLLPHAAHVFVDTVCSDQVAEPGKNLYCIRGFSSFELPTQIPSH